MAAQQNVSSGPIGVQSPARVKAVPPGPPRNQVPQTGLTGSNLAADAITRRELADAAGMPGITRAALFEPGIAGSMQRCSFSFDPTNSNTTNITVQFKRRGLSLPAASTLRQWSGNLTADKYVIAYVNTAGVYTVEMRENTTTLLSHTWTDDLEEHDWTFAYSSTGCVISLDGASVASGVTPPSFLDTAASVMIGSASNAATGFLSDHATYRDFRVYGDTTATNRVWFRLDEPAGGPYYNAYLRIGDPLYDASNTSAVQIATTGTDTSRPRDWLVNSVDGGSRYTPDRPRRMRVAAFSGLGDHATAGQFGLVSWAPTGTPAFNVEFDCARSLTQVASVSLWGRIAASYANILVSNAGVILARVNTTTICTTTVAAIPPDGRSRRVRVEFRDSGADVTAAIYVGTRLVVSGTLVATQFSTVAADHYIGGSPATTTSRWSGSIFNVLLEDLNSAANSGLWLMDEPKEATSYANTYPGTSLAALTKNGYVSVCGVESEDGRGRPWQSGDGAPLVYAAYASAAQAGLTAATSLTLDTVMPGTTPGFNPATAFASNALTVPVTGRLEATLSGAVTETSAAAANLTFGLAKDTTLQGIGVAFSVLASEVGKPFSHTIAFEVTKGDVIRARLHAISAGTVTVTGAAVVYKIIENPVAG